MTGACDEEWYVCENAEMNLSRVQAIKDGGLSRIVQAENKDADLKMNQARCLTNG